VVAQSGEFSIVPMLHSEVIVVGRFPPASRGLGLGFGKFQQAFDSGEVGFDRAAAGGGDGIPRHRFAIDELFFGEDVAGIFELFELRAEIAIGFIKRGAEAREVERVGSAKEHENPQPAVMLQQRIELPEGVGKRRIDRRRRRTG
jgi:hypothetical protein